MTPTSKPRRRPKAETQARDDRIADDAAVAALLDLLTEEVSGLPEALDRGEQARRMRAEATRELLGSRELKAVTRQAPELGRNITSTRKELDRQDAAAEQALAEMRDATGEWLAALKSLREPRA